MKIYIDGELPTRCGKCPCMSYNIENEGRCNVCKLGNKFLTYDEYKYSRPDNCPLETTHSLKQQERAEVVEQVKDYMKKHSHTIPVISKNRKVVYNIGLTRFLEQMKGESNDN